jgi:hypothetical protein
LRNTHFHPPASTRHDREMEITPPDRTQNFNPTALSQISSISHTFQCQMLLVLQFFN